jgi:hypothetical protein
VRKLKEGNDPGCALHSVEGKPQIEQQDQDEWYGYDEWSDERGIHRGYDKRSANYR